MSSFHYFLISFSFSPLPHSPISLYYFLPSMLLLLHCIFSSPFSSFSLISDSSFLFLLLSQPTVILLFSPFFLLLSFSQRPFFLFSCALFIILLSSLPPLTFLHFLFMSCTAPFSNTSLPVYWPITPFPSVFIFLFFITLNLSICHPLFRLPCSPYPFCSSRSMSSYPFPSFQTLFSITPPCSHSPSSSPS